MFMNEDFRATSEEHKFIYSTDKSFLSGTPFDCCLALFLFSHYEERVK